MTVQTVSDVLTRIGAIQQQIQELQSGSLLSSSLGTSGGASVAPGGGAGAFAAQLAQAQQGPAGSGSAGAAGSPFGSLAQSALGSAGTLGTSGTSGPGPGAMGVAAGLPASAATLLTPGQQQFAATLSADTGLNPAVVTSWLLAEESGGAAQTRQAANNNDWLNIGYTDSGTYGASDSVWSDPTAAANATAAWLKGQASIPGYGTASAGIQAILTTVGQAPAAQIQALQHSGWSSGGYPSLDALYNQVAQAG